MYKRTLAACAGNGVYWRMTGCLFAVLLMCGEVAAELQQVQVGGQITFYGDVTRNLYTSGSGLRYPSRWLTGRPVGAGPGNADGLYSWAAWNADAADEAQITIWTRLHVRADFSDATTAFIEFESLGSWGDSFRSNYLVGADRRASSDAGVGLYQGYIDANGLFGVPLRLRVGRQELRFGNEWLVGGNDSGPAPNYGLSFDALRATYEVETFSLDLFSSKLAERLGRFGNDDTDFHGVYAAYTGLEEHEVDVYWFWLRDDTALSDREGGLAGEWMQRVMGVDQYKTTNLHTVGIRFSGAFGPFDYDLEGARQFGDAGQVGALFQPGLYGDDNARYDTFGFTGQVGYTFDIPWQPRAYLTYAYLGGEDKRDISFGQWLRYLACPFYTAPASVSFNRLFSNTAYSYVLEASDLSNAQIITLGTSFTPSDKIELEVALTYLRSVAAFHRPVVPFLTFWTVRNDRELGWDASIYMTYYYTQDLHLSLGWSHLFVGKGLYQGHFNSSNGLDFNGGTGRKDADYGYFEIGLRF